MALTAFPGGASSFGIPLVGASGAGKLPSGAVRFVNNSAGMPSSNGKDAAHPFSTLSAALSTAAIAKAGSCGTVFVDPGHSESTATTVLTGLVAGTSIIGRGNGSLRPTFRLTATGAQLAISVNDVYFENILFRLEGANGITKAINVTGANVVFNNCEFEVASGASNKSTIALEFGAGADRFKVINCKFRGTATHNVTDGVKIAGAVDQGEIKGCTMNFSATAANGNIHVAAAATSLFIGYNDLSNTMTASTACIAIDDVASTGLIAYNDCNVLNNGVAANQGVVFAGVTTTTMKCSQNFCSDEPGKSGVLCPGAVAT